MLILFKTSYENISLHWRLGRRGKKFNVERVLEKSFRSN